MLKHALLLRRVFWFERRKKKEENMHERDTCLRMLCVVHCLYWLDRRTKLLENILRNLRMLKHALLVRRAYWFDRHTRAHDNTRETDKCSKQLFCPTRLLIRPPHETHIGCKHYFSDASGAWTNNKTLAIVRHAHECFAPTCLWILPLPGSKGKSSRNRYALKSALSIRRAYWLDHCTKPLDSVCDTCTWSSMLISLARLLARPPREAAMNIRKDKKHQRTHTLTHTHTHTHTHTRTSSKKNNFQITFWRCSGDFSAVAKARKTKRRIESENVQVLRRAVLA